MYRWWWWWWWFFHLHVDGNNNPNEFLVIQQVCGEAERGDEISVDELKTYTTSSGETVIMRSASRARAHFISAARNRGNVTMSFGVVLKFHQVEPGKIDEEERVKIAEAFAAVMTVVYQLELVEKYKR